MKYEPRVVKHVCHPLNEKHESCLVELYRLYFGLVQSISSEITAFYFKPNSKRLDYDKQAVGINKRNGILPSRCKEAGFKNRFPVRAAHSREFVYDFCFLSCKKSQNVAFRI